MIRLVEEETAPLLRAFCRGSAFGCRVWSVWHAYGGYPFAQVWIQQRETGEVTAAFSKMDGAILLEAAGALSEDLLREQEGFLQAVGYTVLSGPRQALDALPGLDGCRKAGAVLRREALREEGPAGLDTSPPLRAVHTLLCACAGPSFCPPVWEPFYLDVSHRMRHGLCRLCAAWEGDMLAACAMTVAQSPFSAVLGAVAVHPDFRRQGWGTRVVRGILSSLPEALPCFVLRDARENRDFYASLGFSPCGEWEEIQRIRTEKGEKNREVVS